MNIDLEVLPQKYISFFLEILHRLCDTRQTYGGLCSRGDDRPQISYLETSDLPTVRKLHYVAHCPEYLAPYDEGMYEIMCTSVHCNSKFLDHAMPPQSHQQ